jgi:hypothetical protein
MMSADHSGYVGNNAVNIPQAGASAKVRKNRDVLPASVTKRADSNLQYFLDEYSSDPILLPRSEDYALSYDKRNSVSGQQIAQLNDQVAKNILNIWAPVTGTTTNVGTRVHFTTGTAGANKAPAGATGNRKATVMADFKKVVKAMDLDLVPQTGRKCLMTPEMYYDLFDDTTINAAQNYGIPTLPTGVIRQLFGVDIYMKNSTPVFAADGSAIRSYGEDGALLSVGSTDSYSSLFWHSAFTARAIGTIEVFENVADATFYGDIISAQVFAGGVIMRPNFGTYALVQGT